jgi:hypothetical protein
MIIRATLEFDINIDEALEMGFEIDNVEEFAKDQALDTIHSLIMSNSLDDLMTVKEIKEEKDNERLHNNAGL